MTKVYIVECGVYEGRYIGGVFSTAEAAMAACPVPVRAARNTSSTSEREGGWKKDELAEGVWTNGLDWEDHATIEEYEVD